MKTVPYNENSLEQNEPVMALSDSQVYNDIDSGYWSAWNELAWQDMEERHKGEAQE